MDETVTLEFDINGHPSTQSLQIAAVGVLVYVARASTGIESSEISRILGTLFFEFGLSDHDGAHLFEVAEFLVAQEGKLDALLNLINERFDVEQKQRLLSLVWKVVTADGSASLQESAHAATIRQKLGLTIEQALQAQAVSDNINIIEPTTAEEEQR